MTIEVTPEEFKMLQTAIAHSITNNHERRIAQGLIYNHDQAVYDYYEAKHNKLRNLQNRFFTFAVE
jgi:hypothetical protein